MARRYSAIDILDPRTVSEIKSIDRLEQLKEGFFGEEIKRRKNNKKKKKSKNKKKRK